MTKQASPLSETVLYVDHELSEIENTIDWLRYLSPTNNEARWQDFVTSGYKKVPALTYEEPKFKFDQISDRLTALQGQAIGNSVAGLFLKEKISELQLQLSLLKSIDKDNFITASIALFGGTSPSLQQTAYKILKQVPEIEPQDMEASAEDILSKANAWIEEFKGQHPNFTHTAKIENDLNSGLMVSRGNLKISSQIKVPKARIIPLVAHEVGIHMATRFNGSKQPLKTLETGLAGYDSMQEGLAVVAEYLAGYLPPKRLRILAARVVATALAAERQSVEEIFNCLAEEHHLSPEDAFDTAVRAKRGGGLSKDALYLKGVIEVLAYFKQGGKLDTLLIGKYDLKHREQIEQLLNEGIIKPAALIPKFFHESKTKERLDKLKSLAVTDFYQKEPEL